MSSDDAIQTLRTIQAHRAVVQDCLLALGERLRQRAARHDLSKLSPEEFEGFTRINRAAREHPYGTDEYRAGLRQEQPTIDLHYQRNSHHPEHWVVPMQMSLLDLIEMVADWYAAWRVYNGEKDAADRQTWEDSLERQQERFAFSPEQWWFIVRIGDLILEAERG